MKTLFALIAVLVCCGSPSPSEQLKVSGSGNPDVTAGEDTPRVVPPNKPDTFLSGDKDSLPAVNPDTVLPSKDTEQDSLILPGEDSSIPGTDIGKDTEPVSQDTEPVSQDTEETSPDTLPVGEDTDTVPVLPKCPDDGDPCNGFEFYDPSAGGCSVTEPMACSDGDPCTLDFCQPGVGCVFSPFDGGPPVDCDDGNPCTTGETCALGKCVGGSPVYCNDDNWCTDDLCSPVKGCVHTPVPGKSCDDGNLCNGVSVCDEQGFCQVEILPVVCDSSGDLPCQKNQCNKQTGECEFKNMMEGMTCDDGDLCTTDKCFGGICVSTPPKSCSKANESCDPTTGTCECNCPPNTVSGLPTYCAKILNPDGTNVDGCACYPACTYTYINSQGQTKSAVKKCGDDGCGGQCGPTCPGTSKCSPTFQCCSPYCAPGAQCGINGCGDPCGPGCAEGWDCNAGTCLPPSGKGTDCKNIPKQGCCLDGLSGTVGQSSVIVTPTYLMKCADYGTPATGLEEGLVVWECGYDNCSWFNSYYSCGKNTLEDPTGKYPKDCSLYLDKP